MTPNSIFKPEVLAPAGDIRKAYLASEAGADAIYFGLTSLSARSSATNIKTQELNQLVKDLHQQNTRCYVTLNTILYQSELEKAWHYLQICEEAKVDAIIIQDLAWLRIIAAYEQQMNKKLKLEIHASTQMNIHSNLDLIAAQKLGFDRIVFPREISREQLQIWSELCSQKNLDIEIFVHGALCMGVSGRCQMSFAQGGRSANRGSCAQACRMQYKLLDSRQKLIDQGALLSAKDQSLLIDIPLFSELKIKSLKIEGRMKSESYVIATTTAFRKAVDLWAAKQDIDVFNKFILEEEPKLLQVFNRGGSFTQKSFHRTSGQNFVSKNFVGNYGLFLGEVEHTNPAKGEIYISDTIETNHNSSQIKQTDLTDLRPQDQIAIRREAKQIVAPIGKVFKKKSNYIIKGFHPKKIEQIKIGDQAFLLKDDSLEQSLQNQDKHRLPLFLKLKFDIDRIYIEAKTLASGTEIRTDLIILLEKLNLAPNSLSETRWEEQLGKLGNTIFDLKTANFLYVNKAEIPSLRVSQINQIRRDIVEDLEEKIRTQIEKYEKTNINRFLSTNKDHRQTKSINQKQVVQKQNLYNIISAEQLADLEKIDFSKVDQLEIPMLFLSNLKSNSNILGNLLSTYPQLEILIRLSEIMQNEQLELFETLRDYYLYESRINFSANGISTLFPELYYSKLKHINEQANITNKKALKFYLEKTTAQITLSPEWNDPSLDKVLSKLDDISCSRIYLPKNYLTSEMFLNYCPVGKNVPGCKKCITNLEANWSQTYSLETLQVPFTNHYLITYPIHCVSQIYTKKANNEILETLSTKNKSRINYRSTIDLDLNRRGNL